MLAVGNWTEVTDCTLKDSHLQMDHAFEIIGKVQADLTLKMLTSLDFGKDFGKPCCDLCVSPPLLCSHRGVHPFCFHPGRATRSFHAGKPQIANLQVERRL